MDTWTIKNRGENRKAIRVGTKNQNKPNMNLIDRVKNIIVTPKTEWDVIDSETPDAQKILISYVLPLVAIGAIATFIGWGLIGKSYSYGFGSFKVVGMGLGIRYAIISLVGGIAGTYLTAFVIDALATNFKSDKNFGKSFQLAAYSFTPAWVGGVFNILPSLAVIGSLFGIYGLYLLYLGLPKLKKTPQDQVTVYFVVSLVAMIVASFVIALILQKILIPSVGPANFGL